LKPDDFAINHSGLPQMYKEQTMTNNIQRTLLAAMAATAFAAGTAMAAAPEKDPGQQQPTSAQPTQSMDQTAPATSDTSTSAAAYEKFDALDADHDGSIDKQEANASKVLSAQFAKLDTNKDGKLSITEFNNAQNMASIKIDHRNRQQ
jgi:hypothetical protein